MLKLIIFDLDGTLLNTIEDLANSTNYALNVFNFPQHAVEEYNFFVGNGINKLLERALPEAHRNADTVSMIRHEFLKHYAAHSEEFTKPYEGTVELLAKIQDKGLQIAVASNKIDDATVKLTKYFFPAIRFATIVGQREGFPIKPNPAVVDEIIGNSAVAKDEVLYVGDSGVDVMTAHNAGVRFVGVLWGFRPKSELEALGASRFVANTQELEQIIFHE
ncbi:MAG: HAD family hydrolase [Paludibacter sp.]|jgi:phosphoglycolate phosphatase|nr:HAD family hydrolase [Paludibacter sp.]